MTADLTRWIVDRNGDGYPDDIAARFVIAPDTDHVERGFCAALLDLGARLGLETHALPPDLFRATSSDGPPGVELITFRTVDDISPFIARPDAEAWDERPVETPVSGCLTRFFSVDDALEDRDGDLLPDASRIAFDVPEIMPVELAAALANLAARIGLESGGVTFPLVRDSGVRFKVELTQTPARLISLEDGWLASGSAADLAILLDRVARSWPHLGRPETGGAAFGVDWLRRELAGYHAGVEEQADGWELQWSARWEVDDLLDVFRTRILPRLDSSEPIELTVYASEPPELLRMLASALRSTLADAGFADARVTVLRAFKAGLSWLQQVVVPAIGTLPVSRVVVTYRRYELEGGGASLDLPIRFLQELFPGNELLAQACGIPLSAVEMVESDSQDETTYTATAYGADGGVLGRWGCNLLWHAQPFQPALPDAGTVCVTTGGFVVRQGTHTQALTVPTDLERFWTFWQGEVLPRVLAEVEARGGARRELQPFFTALEAEVWISESNEPLHVREENDSAAEALHEDIYFGTLDLLEMLGQRTNEERTNAPGAVIPIVHVRPGMPPHARVRFRRAPETRTARLPTARVVGLRAGSGDGFKLELHVDAGGDEQARQRLGDLARDQAIALIAPGTAVRALVRMDDTEGEVWLPTQRVLVGDVPDGAPPMDRNIVGDAVEQLAGAIAGFPEVSGWLEDTSYEGRPIPALALAAPVDGRLSSSAKAAVFKPTYLVIARHHANEISSTNAAFQLAWLCANDPGWRRFLDRVNVLILPYENPDGAALHERLSAERDARLWKHHPARYNALGFEFGEDHLNPDSRFGEARARTALWRRWPADVVVDNHGVPSHEWVQPFAGFGSSPRFKVSYWVVQALLYGIARGIEGYPEHEAAVLALRDTVSAKVRDTDIGEWNRVYFDSYHFWGQSREPEAFPGEFHDGMLWHIDSAPADPESGRGYQQRYPKTTVLSWVTEVNDETAEGAHLERVARAHLLANQATLELLYAFAPDLQRWVRDEVGGGYTVRVGRERPLRVGGFGRL